MQDFLFDTPYWFLGLLMVAGIALWTSGNARQEAQLKNAAYGLIGLAALFFLLSYFIDTDREKVTRQTRAIVAAVEKKDRAAAERLLHPQANLAGMDKAMLVDRIASAADTFHIKSIRITSLDVQPSEGEMIATLSATTDLDAGVFSGAVPSNWEFTWVKIDRAWLLRDIRPKSSPGMDAQTLTGKIRNQSIPGK